MPVAQNDSVVDILPRHINQIWESCELKEMPVSQYKHLLRSQDNIDDTTKAAITQGVRFAIARLGIEYPPAV